MSNNTLNFTIDLNGNAYKGILQIDNSLKGVLNSVDNARSAFKKLGDASVRFDGITSTIQNLQSAIGGITQAGANAELQLMNLKTLFGGNAEILRKRPTWKTFYAIMFVIYFFTILTKNRKDRKNYV